MHKGLKQQFIGLKPYCDGGNLPSVFVFLAEACFFRQKVQRGLCRVNSKPERQMNYKA